MKIINLFFFAYMITISLVNNMNLKSLNNKKVCQPVFGVLASPSPSNPPSGSQDEKHGTESVSQVDLNYVQWLQIGGAKVIPILPWWSEHQLSSVLDKINGVVFQGGSMKFDPKKDYNQAQIKILEYAVKHPEFVVWGICNGFQAINHWAYDKTNKQNPIYQNNPKMETLLLPLQINHNYKSRILSTLSADQLNNLQNHNTTGHFHSYSVSISKTNINSNYKKLLNIAAYGTNPGNANDQFVNIVEGRNSRIYGTQFHPEKMLNPFYKKTPSNPNGVLDDGHGGDYFDKGAAISKSFAKFIVSQGTVSKCSTESSFEGYSPLPDVTPLLDNEIKKIQNKSHLTQVNTHGIAILSCGRFSYSWYSKTNSNPTKVKFSCSKSQGQA